MPESIKELSYEKEITLFLDGDRGGMLIAKNVTSNAKVDFVAFAPDGKEVEELEGKEILVALRKKIPVDEFLKTTRSFLSKREYFTRDRKEKPVASVGNEQDERARRSVGNEQDEHAREEKQETFKEIKEEEAEINLEDSKEKLKSFLNEVENTKLAIILDKKLSAVEKMPVRNLFSYLNNARNVYAIVADTATPNIIRAAEENNIKNIIAKNFSFSQATSVNLISL